MRSVTVDLIDAMELSIALSRYLNILVKEPERQWDINADKLREVVNNFDQNIINEIQKEV